jgi:phage regulator Rha-like protein
MADELTTKPTIETVLERIIAFENRLTSRFDQFEKEVAARFDSIDNEIDRVASVAHSTKAEMLTLRADFRELRVQLREVLPVLQSS